MKDRGVVPVALVATVGISVQNTGAALGAGWGMIHGAGLGVVVALVPWHSAWLCSGPATCFSAAGA